MAWHCCCTQSLTSAAARQLAGLEAAWAHGMRETLNKLWLALIQCIKPSNASITLMNAFNRGARAMYVQYNYKPKNWKVGDGVLLLLIVVLLRVHRFSCPNAVPKCRDAKGRTARQGHTCHLNETLNEAFF